MSLTVCHLQRLELQMTMGPFVSLTKVKAIAAWRQANPDKTAGLSDHQLGTAWTAVRAAGRARGKRLAESEEAGDVGTDIASVESRIRQKLAAGETSGVEDDLNELRMTGQNELYAQLYNEACEKGVFAGLAW